MTADWAAIDRQHHIEASGRCSCLAADCRIGQMARVVLLAAENAVLLGPPAAEWVSVFAEDVCR